MVVPTTRKLQVGDEITVYNVSGTHTGSFFVKVDDGGAGYEFDSSTLLTDGKLRVAAIVDGIESIDNGQGTMDNEGALYDLSGKKVISDGKLPKGVYIRNGQKVYVK